MGYTKALALLTSAALCPMVLIGCGGPEPALRALQSDPMATATFTGTRVASETKTEGHTAMGKPVHASITRTFRLTTATPEQAVAQAAAVAQDAGWSQTSARPTAQPTAFSSTRQIDEVKARLRVVTAPGPDGPTLFVYLTAD